MIHVEFAVLTFAGLLLPVVAPWRSNRTGRRLFWGGLLVAVVSAFFIAYPPDWKSGVGLSLFMAGISVLGAYFSTPFIKIHGKIYALFVVDSRPDPSSDSTSPVREVGDADLAFGSYGGGITVRKFWWLLVFGAAIFAFNVIAYFSDRDNPRLAAVMAAALVVMATLVGYRDAGEGYPIARGQRLQLAMTSIITAGAFPVLYLLAYGVGRQWPLRRKQSMEDWRKT